jgi:hypothetical protein
LLRSSQCGGCVGCELARRGTSSSQEGNQRPLPAAFLMLSRTQRQRITSLRTATSERSDRCSMRTTTNMGELHGAASRWSAPMPIPIPCLPLPKPSPGTTGPSWHCAPVVPTEPVGSPRTPASLPERLRSVERARCEPIASTSQSVFASPKASGVARRHPSGDVSCARGGGRSSRAEPSD